MDRVMLIELYKGEIEFYTRMLKDGRESVQVEYFDGGPPPPRYARGRTHIPVQEVITHWEEGLYALEHGADIEAYNY